ncbi:MAG: hypothetical protein RBU37_27300, partial [Myxococcota bacterium]|nr:hypothetical protein [Myxococcota bacterium]
MDPIFEPSFMSRLLSWQLDVSHDRSARVLMLVEQARQAEQLARAEGDEKGSSARLAFQKWRQALEAGPELALVRATLMRYLETDVASVEERAQVLDELAKACTREERVAIALLRADRVERAGDRRAAGQLTEDALRLEAGDRRCLQRLERLSRGDADWASWLRWASSLREHSSDARLKLAVAVEEALTLEFQVEDPRACIELCATAGAETSIDLAASASREELALGRWSRAVTALEREASLHAEPSQRVQRLYEAARVALRRLDDAPRAARLLAPVLEQAPLEVLRLLREAYLEQASPELATVYRLLAERALAPEQKARYLCLLGDEWGEGPEAVRVMMEAVELAPTYTSASFGLELAGVGAAVDLLELMARRARVQASAPMMVHVGRLAWDVYRDLERAERCFREALGFPGAEQLIFGAFGALDALAELLDATERYDDLVEVLSWAMSRPMEQQDRLRLQSRFADAVSFSARASLEQRVEAWHTLLHFEPNDAYAFRQLRELLELSGRWQDATAVTERFNESFELSDADWCYVLSWECGVLASRLPEGLEGALAFFDRAIEREPRHPAAWCGRARRLMASGRMRALVADYRRRVELALSERERLRLLLDLAALYERALDDVQAAAILYEELLAAGWHSLDVVHGALRTLSKLEQSASAESWAALRQRRVRVLRVLVGVEADPAFVHVWHYVLGVSCEELGDFESAAASFSAAVAAAPRSATAQLAHHRAELGCGRAG